MMSIIERAVSAVEGISYNLGRIANVQEALLRAEIQEAVSHGAQAKAAEEIIPAPQEAPQPAKEAPRKARVERRAAVRDAAKAAGLTQKDIEKAVGAPYAEWTAEHCQMVEGMTSEQLAINEAKAQEADEAIEEPTLTEAPAEEVQAVSEADLDEVVEPEVLAAEVKADAPSDDDIRKAVVAWANIHGKEAAKKMIKEIGGADRLADVPDRAHWVALYHAMSAKEAA